MNKTVSNRISELTGFAFFSMFIYAGSTFAQSSPEERYQPRPVAEYDEEKAIGVNGLLPNGLPPEVSVEEISAASGIEQQNIQLFNESIIELKHLSKIIKRYKVADLRTGKTSAIGFDADNNPVDIDEMSSK